ncbi:dihydropteroate synthase [Helicobacter sp. 16-1353]|uniref:dihydropteroate synthase n=1 Tax=Helicobacter sp. 16-1353 TaxID=2004996 RepID=UPI000DCD6339|nr:dihydropteroate synthase [Helicobacter sp. 16-1353]RAX53196.1 dihydropteroate synthase [Helicobacter sp. 16-1353]
MNIYRLKNLKELENIGATEFANNLAMKKGRIFYFKINNLRLPAMHILKQESISVGGDFITPKEAILSQNKTYSGILIATQSQLERIIQKCKIQDFGLKNIAKTLQTHIKNPDSKPKIMGIINITEDSFYEDSRIIKIDDILQKVNKWIDLGVDIIDIGGVSSRPGSEFVDSTIELNRIKEAIIALEDFTKKAVFSIDSYNFETIRFCLERGFRIINDVYSLKDERLISLAKEFQSDVVLMHNSWIYPHTKDNIILELDDFFTQKIELLDKYGIKNIILDIGFGFGKNKYENLELIDNLEHFLHFGYRLLVGASRKTTIGEILSKDATNRLSGTLALHQIALNNGANIIRCHDVEEHLDMFKIINEFR